MSIRKTWVPIFLAFVVGVGTTFFAETIYWNNELASQFREKDRLFAELKQSAEALQNSNQELSTLNTRMSTTIQDALEIVTTLDKQTEGSIERMKRIVSALKRLKELLLLQK